jgi:hypothetical protein
MTRELTPAQQAREDTKNPLGQYTESVPLRDASDVDLESDADIGQYALWARSSVGAAAHRLAEATALRDQLVYELEQAEFDEQYFDENLVRDASEGVFSAQDSLTQANKSYFAAREAEKSYEHSGDPEGYADDIEGAEQEIRTLEVRLEDALEGGSAADYSDVEYALSQAEAHLAGLQEGNEVARYARSEYEMWGDPQTYSDKVSDAEDELAAAERELVAADVAEATHLNYKSGKLQESVDEAEKAHVLARASLRAEIYAAMENSLPSAFPGLTDAEYDSVHIDAFKEFIRSH